MTGPEHYRTAEELIAGAMKHRFGNDGDWQKDPERHHIADALIAEAQVHATLALAAATALCHPGDDQTLPEDANAWVEAAGERRPS